MKLHGWSVVRSPNGLSLMHLDPSNEPTDPEICISVEDKRLTITLHLAGVDEPIQTMQVSLHHIER